MDFELASTASQSQEISAFEFEQAYIKLFHDKSDEVTARAATTVSWLFTEVDAYSDNPQDAIEYPVRYLNEDQLRESAQKALNELNKLS